jgi:AAA ATPase domain
VTTNLPTVGKSGPYLGLRPFEAEDARFFFGRKREIELLAANLRTSRASLVYGESGVGKSSLIRAGLAPWLGRQSAESVADHYEGEKFAAVVLPFADQSPADSLAQALIQAVSPTTDGPRGELSLLAAIDYASRQVDRVLIVLDQFEEYLAYADLEDGSSSTDTIIGTVTSVDLPIHLMLVIREDAISRLDRLGRRVREFAVNPIRIEPLAEGAVREAIHGPLRVYNEMNGTRWSVESAFEDAVIEATRAGNIDLGVGGRGGLAEANAQPIETAYLQIVLKRIWATEQQAGSSVLSLQTFEKLEGVEGIVRAHLDEIMGGLRRAEQGVAAAAFQYLVTPSGMKVPYSSWDLAKLTGEDAVEVDQVLGRLSSAKMRIVRPLSPSPRGDVRYEIYHDRLADPILDWRIRRVRGGDRVIAVRAISFFTGLLAVIGACIILLQGGSRLQALVLAAIGTVYLLASRVTIFVELVGEFVDDYDRASRRLARRLRAKPQRELRRTD